MKSRYWFSKKIAIISFLIIVVNNIDAQIIDNFSDGNYTSNPTWIGDDSLFIVSSTTITGGSFAPRLQLNANQAGTSYLSTANVKTTLDSTEWRFWIRLNLGTSNNNNCRVYLTSDIENLKNPLNGYFIMFGDDVNASIDNISLYKQQGTTTTKIINGTIANTNLAKNYRIKVTRNNAGLWSLYSDTTGGTNYFLEGSATETSLNTSQYLGVLCKYTVSNKANFFFDDFYCGPIDIDNVAPVLNKITTFSSTQLELQFSEAIDQITANNINNYSVNQGVGLPITAEIDAINPSIVKLTFSQSFQQNNPYLLTVSDIKDLVGNTSTAQNTTFTYYTPNSWDIVINEIMADPDPAVGLPDVEYIELKNNTSLPINLNGWSLKLGTTLKTLPNYELLADSFVVITDEDFITAFGANIATIGLSSMSITNGGQEISLSDPSSKLIHYITFSDSWYGDDLKKNGGWSLEQIDPFNYCGESSNWEASTDFSGGTPGKRNSIFSSNPDNSNPEILRAIIQDKYSVMVYFSESMDVYYLSNLNNYLASPNLNNPISALPTAPSYKSVLLTFADSIVHGEIYSLTVSDTITDCYGNILTINSNVRFAFPNKPEPKDLIINEILSNPREDGVDFIELINISQKVIDLKQLLLGNIYNGVAIMKTITTEGYLLFPDAYVVLSSNSNAVKQQYITQTTKNFVQLSSFPTYNNDDGVVVLTDINNIEIDKVAYNLSMHYPLLKTTDGVSLERIFPLRSSVDNTNWHSAASNVGYATPGYKNSQYSENINSPDEITIEPEVFSPDNDGLNDNLNINYKFTENGYRINIWIYNSSGAKIKHIANNELIAIEGTFSWDGTTIDKHKAPSGIYVVFIEVWKTDGTVKKFKKAATLGVRF